MNDDPIEELLEEARDKMRKAVEHLREELSTVRTGRASPAMLDGVKVDYYGTKTPLEQLASVSAPAPDLIVVQPWDRDSIEDIEKAILSSDLGLNPNNDGEVIRVPIPPLSEERRKELAKAVSEWGEEARISIRNTRRTIRDQIESVQEEENMSEDVYYAAEEDLQEITDEYIDKADTLVEKKEEELMTV